MKEYIIIVSVLIITFVPNVIFKNYLKDSGDELIEIVNEMRDDIADDSVEDKEKSKELKSKFKDSEKKWILIVDHEALDEIENYIEECIAFYDAEDKMEFNGASSKVINLVDDLTKREEITFSNIM